MLLLSFSKYFEEATKFIFHGEFRLSSNSEAKLLNCQNMEWRWHFSALTMFHHLVVLHLFEWQKLQWCKNTAFLVIKKSGF